MAHTHIHTLTYSQTQALGEVICSMLNRRHPLPLILPQMLLKPGLEIKKKEKHKGGKIQKEQAQTSAVFIHASETTSIVF